jgi:hypothetical protein
MVGRRRAFPERSEWLISGIRAKSAFGFGVPHATETTGLILIIVLGIVQDENAI